MDRVIHNDEEETGGTGCHVGMPTVQQYRNVMVPMKENQGLLMHNNKEGIDQFGEFAQDEELHPESGGAGAVQRCGIVAQIVAEGICHEIVVKLGCRAERADPGEEGEAEVPKGEGASPTPRRF